MTEQEFIDSTVRDQAARAMLRALKAAQERFDADNKRMRIVDDAIAQAEAAGIKGEG